MNAATACLASPLGLLLLTGTEGGLSAVSFHGTEGLAPTRLADVPA